jgi:hypothetical protein
LLFSDKENLEWQVKTQAKASIMVTRTNKKRFSEKAQLTEIRKQAIKEAGKLKKANQGKETNSVEVICTERDIFHAKKGKKN